LRHLATSQEEAARAMRLLAPPQRASSRVAMHVAALGRKFAVASLAITVALGRFHQNRGATPPNATKHRLRAVSSRYSRSTHSIPFACVTTPPIVPPAMSAATSSYGVEPPWRNVCRSRPMARTLVITERAVSKVNLVSQSGRLAFLESAW